MKTTRIQIKNLFGIKETTLDGKSVELSGHKGAGKTSVLDGIRYALTNKSDRDYVVRQGEDAGEIIIETDTGLKIDRKVDAGKTAGTVKVKQGNFVQSRPAEFLQSIFTPLQLNPVEFTQMSRQEKNRVILSLIKFDWDLDWIQKQFGEIPKGVNYNQHILQVLEDIQANNGVYYTSRQEINRDIRNQQAFINDIAKSLPDNYDYDRWNNYPVSQKYQELVKAKDHNDLIRRAQNFRASYDSKMDGIQGRHDMAAADLADEIAREREFHRSTIERLKAQIQAAQDKLDGLDQRQAERMAVIDAQRDAEIAKLDADIGTANKYADAEIIDTKELQDELDTANEMRKHLSEYRHMADLESHISELHAESEDLTDKIELARELPAKILAECTIPIEGLTVEHGVPLVHGRPVSNLSDGELLELCVDVATVNPGQLQIILIDGAERLDTESREKLYAKCKAKGLQLIATRVADTELEVTEL